MRLKCSVVMTTYNGGKYIETLLESLRKQTRQPDEVIICDDASTDDTTSIVEKYIEQNRLKNWHLYINHINIGWRTNFRNAMNLASGDLIFLCDQDDIWRLDKIEKMEERMSCADIKVLVSNYEAFFDTIIETSEQYYVRGLGKQDGSIKKINLSPYFFSCMRPGCTYCVRKTFYNVIKERDDLSIPHDDVLWASAIANDGLYLLNLSLIKFRRHGDNASTVNSEKTIDRRIDNYGDLIRIADWVLESNMCAIRYRKQIQMYKAFMCNRCNIIKKRRIVPLLKFAIKNFKFYPTLRNLLSDFYIIIKDKYNAM